MSENLCASTSSINDVYEFHSSPESNGAASPVSLLPTLSASMIQKSSQLAPSMNMGLVSNAVTTLPVSSTLSSLAVSSVTVTTYVTTPFKAVDDTPSTQLQKSLANSSNGLPAPKRIKTATLAKELLAAAAASASLSVVTLNSSSTSISTTTTTSPITNSSIKQNREKEKDINDDNDLDKNFFFEDTSTEDSNKKVPPLRILLPKTLNSEDDNGTITSELNSISTVDVDMLTIVEADISSGSGTQSPMLKTNETLDELNAISTKKLRSHAQLQNPVEEQSQQRLTRSRVRQTGAVIADDITSYPSSAKRKAGAINLRLRGGKREKTATPARETLIVDSNAFIGALTLNEAISGLQSEEVDSSSGVIAAVVTAASLSLTDNAETFGSMDDEECSRQSFETNGGGKQDEDGDEDDDANEKEEESNAKDLAVTLLFSKNSFETSLEFNQVIRNKWVKDFTREIKQLEMDRNEITNCIDAVTAAHKFQKNLLADNLQKHVQAENESKTFLPISLEKLYNEHVKRRIQLCKTQFNERERFLDHGMREYFRLSSTQTNRMSTFNAVRLLRDSELYDPFTPNLLIDESINNTASYLAPKSQVFKRLKAMNTAMKNRQIMESHSLYVTQLAEWQKAVRKFNRFQQKQKQEQQNNCNEEQSMEEWKILSNEGNQQLINYIVRVVPIEDLIFPFPLLD